MEMTRPNGKLYRSRKGLATVFIDGDFHDSGNHVVLVIRTGNYEVARRAAFRRMSDHDPESAEMMQVRGGISWWREAIRDGEPYWVEDEVRGCPGFYFETRW